MSLRPPKTKKERIDEIRVRMGSTPNTPWGERYRRSLTPAQHTPVYAHKPNKSIHIYQ